MIKLQAYNSERIYWAVEQVEREAGDIDSLHLDDNLFYIKSEADKLIAKLEAENRELKRALWLSRADTADSFSCMFRTLENVQDCGTKEHNENYRFDSNNMLHKIMKQNAEIRHQKYKRCWAMAKLWLERAENSTDLENELVSRRRCSKWMELAEKFKEQ